MPVDLSFVLFMPFALLPQSSRRSSTVQFGYDHPIVLSFRWQIIHQQPMHITIKSISIQQQQFKVRKKKEKREESKSNRRSSWPPRRGKYFGICNVRIRRRCGNTTGTIKRRINPPPPRCWIIYYRVLRKVKVTTFMPKPKRRTLEQTQPHPRRRHRTMVVVVWSVYDDRNSSSCHRHHRNCRIMPTIRCWICFPPHNPRDYPHRRRRKRRRWFRRIRSSHRKPLSITNRRPTEDDARTLRSILRV